MDAESVEAATAEPAQEAATLLRVIADRPLTAAQSADLDAVLAELEHYIRAADSDRSVLYGPVGDLKIIELTALDGEPVSKTQRDRVKRLAGALAPPDRRPMLRRRR